MAELRVPKLNNNDTEYLLVEWLVPDGTPVHEDDAVVLVETSKATEELPADTNGVLRHVVKAGAWCRPDEVIATVGDDAPVIAEDTAEPGEGPLVTAPAQALIDAHGITPEQVAALGVRLVRRADVERLVAGARLHELPRVQRAVARAVEVSHQTIPAAYVAVRMDLGPALERAKALTKEVRRPVGVAEVFVQAVAGLHGEFPLFFAALQGNHAVLSETPDIGVTVDLGEGLYVPVVHDAAGRTLKDVAVTLMKHRLAATTGEFKESDLGGANFVVTLHTEGEVEMAIPFVFPGTACALAVTAPADGGSALIGLAYDHRLINGRDASLFLAALRTAVAQWSGGVVA
ncbi:2-oxo acid dehydrogenase subunit E2 [Nonomuraea typhae]|uniref:Dihydrolipoamide acetyltransferase component of pyruvate dehydrogenase complex n=1 Tax=Nonomuraea typhae TaxID=2603600 RepID=A0ABW7YRG4_9ACTN